MAAAFVVQTPSRTLGTQSETTHVQANRALPVGATECAIVLKTNTSHASERGVREEIREVEDRQWAVEHATFVANTREWAEKNGAPLDEYRAF